MIGKLLLIFISIPLIEILILIKLGEVFGFWNTVIFVIGMGFLGAFFARLEGWRAWNSFHQALARGEMPGEHMIDTFIIFIAGIFLITPGLLTDLVGLFLLIPWTRYLLKRALRKKFDQVLRDRQGSSLRFIRLK